MFNRILVPIDGSSHADQALDTAVSLAKNLMVPPKLIVVYVGPVLPLDTPMIALDLESEWLEETRSILSPAEKKLQAAGLEGEVIEVTGDPARLIVQTAKKRNVDLIVMGSRGINILSEMLMGSVSRSVVKQAHCPVMVVR